MINHPAVIAAAVSDLAVGALWFSPLLFHKAWFDSSGMTEEKLKQGSPAFTYGMTFVLSLIISYNLAFFLDDPATDAAWGMAAGFLAGLWAFCGFAILCLFEKRSLKYALVNGFYMLIAFSLKGLIIGAWRG